MKTNKTRNPPNANQKPKGMKRITSPTLKSNNFNDVKNFKSQKELSFLQDSSMGSLKTESFLDEKIQITKVKQSEEFNKTQTKKIQKPTSPRIPVKITNKKKEEQKDKTKKNNHSIKDEEIKIMKQEYEKIEKDFEKVRQENEQKDILIKQLQNQNSGLKKKMERQSKIMDENKKMIKEKIENYNRENEEIRQLKIKIGEMEKNSKIPTVECVDIGTQIQIVEVQEVNKENFGEILERIKKQYQSRFKQMNNQIMQQEEQIISLERQLNEKYLESSFSFCPQLNSDSVYLEQIQTISKLKDAIIKLENQVDSMKLSNQSLSLQIQELKFESQVMYHHKEESNNEKEMKALISSLEETISEKNAEVWQLSNQLSVQSVILQKSNSKRSIIRK